ncbi:MAG: hypothetical protein KDD53_06955, partial [Bdellovibrionales bacterium]|nr:hypothetical protein [Bdellovibrionales bacterium]
MSVREKLRDLRESKKQILVVGFGVTGQSVARVLVGAGLQVIVVERANEDRFSGINTEINYLREQGAQIHFGVEGEVAAPLLRNVGLCVVSPGISLESAVLAPVLRNTIPIISEIDFATDLLGIKSIVVTGSNGKSTTVSLIHDFLQCSGRNSVLCGNIGRPVIDELTPDLLWGAKQTAVELLVIEASSYQLETCTLLHPKVAVWLNLSDNHLERHGTLERYLQAKSRVFARQSSSDFAVLNGDDPYFTLMRPYVSAEQSLFFKARPRGFKQGAYLDFDPSRGRNELVLENGSFREVFDLSEIKL